MARKYDVIIVGGGPAGIFAALELSQAANLNILLIEKGRAPALPARRAIWSAV
jgi:flavin-dependent dehydrogenase